MKNLESLKGLVDYFWFIIIYFSYPIIILSPLFLPYVGECKPNEEYFLLLKISPNWITIDSFWSKILLYLSIANTSLIILALYNFRKVLMNFQKDIVFEKETENLLKRIGALLNSSAYVFIIIEVVLMIMKGKRHFAMFTLFAVIITIGLFFTVLAELFKKARKLKEENELTI